MICERFDYLMNLTNTRNSDMGRALSFDSSYIGKIRHGDRKPPKNGDFTEKAAEYLARRITEEYQKSEVSALANGGVPLPADISEVADLLFKFLTVENNEHRDEIKSFLSALSSSASSPREGGQQRNAELETADGSSAGGKISSAALFTFGNSGKRDSVLRFLTQAATSKSPVTLLLYSDEDMKWLYEDDEFAKRWGSLLASMIARGGSIRIIHTVSRDLAELLEAVKKWVPLYISGAVEPWFYPAVRDGIYRRSLFIIPGSAALTSVSVGSHTEGMANILTGDKAAVAAFEKEFDNYFALCRPLMRIHHLPDAKSCFERVLSSVKDDKDVFICSSDRCISALPETDPAVRIVRSDFLPEDMLLTAKKNGGAMIVATSENPIIYEIGPGSISEALYRFISR